MTKPKGKKAKKIVRRQIKKKFSDDRKITKKELKQVKKRSKKKGINLKKTNIRGQIKRVVKKDAAKSIRLKIKKAGRDGKITRKEVNKIKNKAKKQGINTKQLGIKFNTGKAVKKQLQKYAKKQDKKGKKGTDINKPANKTISKIKGKGKYFEKLKIRGDKQLDKFINKNVLDQDILTSPKRTKDQWNPNRVEKKISKQWIKRFKGKEAKESFKPKRLNIDIKSTGRMGKYTNKDGDFNHKKYLADVRQSSISRAKERGLKGDITKALSSTGPKMPGEAKPKYGSAITELKNKFGKINYKDKIAETTSKLTGEVKSNASTYKDTGLDIIKRRRSEDGALPPIKFTKIKSKVNDGTSTVRSS